MIGLVAWPSVGWTDQVQVHALAGVAHAVGGPQEQEFGLGGAGALGLELPVSRIFGAQLGASSMVLPSTSDPSDPSLAPRGTGTALLGMAGVRVHPLGAAHVAGLWLDGNAGVARTGDLSRFAVDTHVGWDFRISSKERIDMGPFVGYTQILEPSDALRSDDARIVWAGLAVSLGRSEPKAPAIRAPEPIPPPLPAKRDQDGLASATDMCPDAPTNAAPERGCGDEITIVNDRIVLGDTIHFEFGSPTIHSQSHRLVHRVARFLEKNAEILTVSIEGHADAVGDDATNQQLSVARAESTRSLLIGFGVAPGRLQLVGHGKRHLKVATPLPELRNRRVEFVVERATVTRHKAGVAAGTRGQP